jgi:N-methylhydantoinase B
MFSGFDRKGEWFQLFQIGFGGIPGRPFGDGPDGHSLWPGFTNVPNEFLERYFPMVIERYETVPDSGGAGFFRGGNGIKMTYRFTEAGTIAIHDDRWFVPPWGVNGGLPGKRSSKLLRKRGGETLPLPSKCDGVQVERGDELDFITWGGGGWGDPLTRDPELVALEIRRGLVTPEGARNYGVVADAQGGVDAAATAALRAELAAARKEIPVFSRGPSIDELRATCEAETGLPAPIAPVWRNTSASAALAAE